MLNFRMKRMFALFMTVGCLAGCYDPKTHEEETYLVQVGETTLTTHDYRKALEIHKTAYDYGDAFKDPAVVREAKLQILKEMIERMTLLERARELGLQVDKTELEAAVQEVQKGYPEGAFEEVLLESAVSFESWKKELSDRLLLEKVIQRDLAEGILISEEAVQAYIDTHHIKIDPPSDARRAEVDQEVRDHLRREKVETAYPVWVEKLQKKYTIEINESDWQEIVGP
ncbi:MAG: SurA N-terminal domain-containing protein [Thermodesulfobacteriota bacterium]